MKKSILITSAVAGTIGLLAAVSTFAATGTSGTMSTTNVVNKVARAFGGEHGMRGGMGPMSQMTDAEKTAFEAMSDADKKTYIEKKRIEMEAKHDASEAVIDKLLAGTALITDEETLRKEIITERTARKVERAQMKAKMEQMKVIFDKKKAGTALTADEQKLLDSMPKMGGREGKGEHMKGGNRQM
jgi:hypothetical protein